MDFYLDDEDRLEDFDYFDYGVTANPYRHNYGPGFKFVTNTFDSSLEEHIAKYKEEGYDFYKGDYSNLVAFPDAYDVYGRKVESMIAICRRID